jgi:hypothetical protein
MSDLNNVPQTTDPKKMPQKNPFKRFARNRYARVTGVALVPAVILGMVWLVPRLTAHPSQVVANAALPSFGNEQYSGRPVMHPAPAARPSPAAKKAAQPPSSTRKPSSPPPPGGTGAPHVMVIMEENKGYTATLGSCGSDPYLCSLAATYASDTAWFGVYHPSEPNYVALASGGIQGCVSDNSCAANSLSQTDLGGQLTAAGVPWVGYMESMPSPCYTGGSTGGYALKHNPFGFFKDNYRGTCHILPYPGAGGLISVLNAARPPDFVWITPNLTNDMHSGTVQQGDAWLKANLGPVLSSPWFTAGNATVIVTMDENDAQKTGTCCSVTPGGQVPMVVISSDSKGKRYFAIPGDHYGTLRSIEEVYHLGLLGLAASALNGDLFSLFG